MLVLALSGCDLIFPFDVDAPRPDSAPAVDRELPHHVDLSPDSSPIPGSWVRIQDGTFTMGSHPNEPCRFSNETQHSVTLSRVYQIMATEVTQGQFGAMMGYNPARFSGCGDACPMESVTWHEAAAYCNALSKKAGLPKCYVCNGSGAPAVCSLDTSLPDIYSCAGFRLPTEAEWEHAYRAGTTTALYNGAITVSCKEADPNAGEIAWYSANSGGATHPVAMKEPNAWGLYDMAGNVWEWVHDGSVTDLGPDPVIDPWGDETQTDRVIRGGSWSDDLTGLRAACREGLHHPPADTRADLLGFRCARTE
jgi:formylglycine-generating enzyme required for sulfatase activity